MKVIREQDKIKPEDLVTAKSILARLSKGDRVFGNPAEGLKETLKKKEKEKADILNGQDKLAVVVDTSEIDSDIAKLKAGIKGEENLAEYLQSVVKYDKELQDIIFFASLSDPNQNAGGDDYTSDSDFVGIYGDHLLIVDAKNIPTNPDIPLYIENNTLCAVGGAELIQLHPAVHVWRKALLGVPTASINGCVVIVNNKGATIWKNQTWKMSQAQPIHQTELVSYLHEWISGKQPVTHLSLLLAMQKMQIRKINPEGDAIRAQMRRFGI